jgi:hypothetical protein
MSRISAKVILVGRSIGLCFRRPRLKGSRYSLRQLKAIITCQTIPLEIGLRWRALHLAGRVHFCAERTMIIA